MESVRDRTASFATLESSGERFSLFVFLFKSLFVFYLSPFNFQSMIFGPLAVASVPLSKMFGSSKEEP